MTALEGRRCLGQPFDKADNGQKDLADWLAGGTEKKQVLYMEAKIYPNEQQNQYLLIHFIHNMIVIDFNVYIGWTVERR